MAKAAKRRIGDEIGGWRLQEKIGGGGNGIVWRVSKAGEPERALKELRNLSAIARDRLAAEIEALGLAAGIEGIIPLLEHDLPFDPAKAPRWFVMPIARDISTLLGKRDALAVVKHFVPLAKTLAELHALGIHHRDIKPANLLVLNGRLCFSDFGLVKYPSRKDITPDRSDVGPRYTMAPEMRREAAKADGSAADVYSFAKTLWIALVGELRGFDGQYSPVGVLSLGDRHPRIFSTPLDELLSECTDNDPTKRPSMVVVQRRLADWIVTEEDFHKRNLSEWFAIQKQLFPHGAPSQATWTGIDEICSVLRLASSTEGLNHMFFAEGGGNTLRAVTLAAEPGFIRLDAGLLSVAKPRKLTYEAFGMGARMNYFRLELEDVDPTGTPGAYISRNGHYEAVCEIRPGEYVTPEAWENDEYKGSPLPAGAALVSRLLKGSLVIFSTRSPYNLTTGTYDGRHDKVSEADFRAYIARNVARMEADRKAAADAGAGADMDEE
ncbi:protein kinase domain-containing protein [Sphingomonas sp. Leaf4]|uniref:protein kinase domain-containing protein n=1 Tax=Sphingomonas sp. Leaf4 TaxID=2876553 RepID=UPI001E352855|nr:protein kinase [Sphingomonas sp. Leaf4]